MTTLLNNFPPPAAPGTSCPGTPMSGVSTVAIKDGHEGIRHSHHHQPGDSAAQERLARLGAYAGNYSATGSVSEVEGDGEGYFERVAEWRDHDDGGPPEEQRGLSAGEFTGDPSSVGSNVETYDTLEDDDSLPRSPGPKSSLTQKLADKFTRKSKLPDPPRRSASSYSAQAPDPPCPTPVTPATPATPLTQARNPLSQVPSTHYSPNNNLKGSASSSTSAFGAGNGNGTDLLTPYSTTGAPSPASTVTTNSVREAKHRAKMLGPMTYDEGVVDTTSQDGNEIKRSPSPGIILNEGDAIDLEARVEGSRKERLDDIEERIVGGKHGTFRD